MLVVVSLLYRQTIYNCPAAGELLDTPPPGVDEAIAIAKVIQFLKVPAVPPFILLAVPRLLAPLHAPSSWVLMPCSVCKGTALECHL